MTVLGALGRRIRGPGARVIGLVGGAHFFSHFYHMSLPPLFPLLKEELGVSYTALGLLVTVFGVAAGLGQTPVGFLVDRLGGRRVLMAGLVLQALAIGLIAFVSGYWALLALFLIAGLAQTTYHPADYAILSDKIARPRVGRAYSLHAFTGNIGSAVAPLVMVAAAVLWNWRVAFFLAGLAGLAMSYILWRRGSILDGKQTPIRDVSDGSPVGGPGLAEMLRRSFRLLLSPPVLMCFLFSVSLTLALGGIRNFSVVALVAIQDVPLAYANGALSGFLFGTAAGVLVGGVAVDRFGPSLLVAGAALLLPAAGLMILAEAALAPMMVIAVLSAAGVARGMINPARDMMVLSAAPEDGRGKVFAFVFSGASLGGAIMPLIFGWLMDQGSPARVFQISAAILVAALILFAFTRRLTSKS